MVTTRRQALAGRGLGTRTIGFTAPAALAPISWGTAYLVTAEFLPPDRPLLAGLLSTLPTGLAALLWTRCLPSGQWWWRAAVLGVLNIGTFFALLYVSAYRLPGGVAATLNAMQPLLVTGLAAALLGERPTRWRVGWGLAGVTGVALMVLRGEAGLDPVGVTAGVGAAVSMAAGTVLTKRWGQPERVGMLSFTGWQLTTGGLLLLPLTAVLEGAPPALDAAAVGGYLWLGIVATLLAYLLWFQGISRLPALAVSFLGLLSPMVATALGWLILAQPLTPGQAAGLVLVMIAILAAQLDPRARPPAGLPAAVQ